MRRQTGLLVVLLVSVALVSMILLGTTYRRSVDSNIALRGLAMQFNELQRHADPGRFTVHLSIINGGEVSARIETLPLSLRLDNRLIAVRNWYPEDLVLVPGEREDLVIEMISNLDRTRLEQLGTESAEASWVLETSMMIEQPVRKGAVLLHRKARLRPK